MKLPNYHPDQSKTVQNTGIETQTDKASKLASRYLDATEPEDSELRTLQSETDAANIRAAEIKFSKTDKATANKISWTLPNAVSNLNLIKVSTTRESELLFWAIRTIQHVQAEHAALEAVAEAVEQHIIYGDMPKEVQVAITNLVAIREQKAGAK